jgi:hypothetical protein
MKLLLPVYFVVLLTMAQAQTFLNFDEQAGTLYPVTPSDTFAGNLYAGVGLQIATGTLAESAPALSDTMTLSGLTSAFSLVTFSGPSYFASAPNALFPAGAVDGQDLIFSFSTPITALSFYTDFVAETPDTFSLLGLKAQGGGSFLVVDRFDYLDNATTLPESFVTRDYSANPVDAVVWLAPASDTESIDNLSFTTVPEPASGLLLMGSLAWICAGRRRSRRR